MAASVIGAQLYTLRDHLKTPPEIAKTLARVRKMGYEAVQVSGVGAIDRLAKNLPPHMPHGVGGENQAPRTPPGHRAGLELGDVDQSGLQIPQRQGMGFVEMCGNAFDVVAGFSQQFTPPRGLAGEDQAFHGYLKKPQPVLRPSRPASTSWVSSGQGRYLGSPNSAYSTRRIDRQTSRPTKSANCSGPMG